MIRIVKASAGSGKTYTLTKQYISLLLDSGDRFAYRHILAVTFTTAATAEMKSRILKELHVLSQNPAESPYLNDFVPSHVPDVQTLQDAAGEILSNILHDYGSFSVSTIDSFFQKTLKAFSREIGQFASYQLELDEKAVQEEAVDDLLDSLTENDSQTLGWITDSALEQVEQNGYYSMDRGLKEMAGSLKSEEHRVKVEQSGLDEKKIYLMDNILMIKSACERVIRDFEGSVRGTALEIVSSMESAGLSEDNFFNNFMKPVYNYTRQKKGQKFERPNDTFMKRACDPELWFRKPKTKAMAGDLDEVKRRSEGLAEPIRRLWALFGEPYKLYLTLFVIKRQLYDLGLTGALYRSYNKVLKAQNVLCISDTNLILKDIIAGSDTPFIYEKTGVRYENFLLDEFQDTSGIQWENFEPLLKESNDSGHQNFIVGDVKQSIYRWRGSDWNLLARDLEKKMPDAKTETLDTNFRSLANVVNFNNEFFIKASVELDGKLRANGVLGDEDFIKRIYEDVRQICAAEKNEGAQKGCVSLTFCDRNCENQMALNAVREVMDSGGRQGDIAVLTRRNSDGADVAKFLIEAGYNVMTADSLNLKSSLTVGRLTSLMSAIDNPGDTVGAYLASSLGIDTSCEYQSLVELCEALIRELRDYDRRQGEDLFDKEVAFVDAFVDAVAAYANVHGNSLHGFLSYWKEKDLKIACPEGNDAIRVVSVHASKGLEFPYVIFPYAEAVSLFRPDKCWCVPEKNEGVDEVVYDCVYNMRLSSQSRGTMFEKDYAEEMMRQYVDNINLLYVALTRASKGLYIIGRTPSKGILEYDGGAWRDFSSLHDALYMFAKSGEVGLMPFTRADEPAATDRTAPEFCETFRVGTMPRFDHKDDGSAVVGKKLDYPSYPVDIVHGSGKGKQGRLVLNGEYSDFFSGDGEPGNTARTRGVVMHNILSAMKRPEDLDAAVDQAVVTGEISSADAPAVKSFMKSRVDSAVERGWFRADATVYNEAGLIDVDGNVYRPDRVEVRPDGGVLVVDYKFAEPKQAYLTQISRYAGIWRRMGHSDVTACLWYVRDDRVVVG